MYAYKFDIFYHYSTADRIFCRVENCAMKLPVQSSQCYLHFYVHNASVISIFGMTTLYDIHFLCLSSAKFVQHFFCFVTYVHDIYQIIYVHFGDMALLLLSA